MSYESTTGGIVGPISKRRIALLLFICIVLLLAVVATASAAPGEVDTSFNGTGMRTYQPRGVVGPTANDVLVQPDGKILVLASIETGAEQNEIVVMRLNPDGSLDGSFGVGGVASVSFAKGGTKDPSFARSMALQSDGKILVVGSAYIEAEHGESDENLQAVVARLNPNGTLDTGFGVGVTDQWAPGELVLGLGVGESGGVRSEGDSANAVVVRPDGRIVVSGGAGASNSSSSVGDFFALGLTAGGGRDKTFGNDGRAFVDFGGGDSAEATALTSNGSLILAGQTREGSTSRYAIACLSSTGGLVTGFGNGGKESLENMGDGLLTGVAVQPDGKLVFAATRDYEQGATAGLIRLNGDGSVDSLGGQSFQPMPPSGGYDESASVAIDSEGRLLVSALSTESNHKVTFRLARFTAAGVPDTTFGSGGLVVIPVGETSNGRGFRMPWLALQPDGRIVLAGTDNFLVDVRRFIGGSLAQPSSEPGPTAGGAGGTGGSSGSTGGSSGSPGGGGTKPSLPQIGRLKAKVDSKAHRATFTFVANGAATGFECALVKPSKKRRGTAEPSFSDCHSPRTYKSLTEGEYTFEVRATNATGAGPAETRKFHLG